MNLKEKIKLLSIQMLSGSQDGRFLTNNAIEVICHEHDICVRRPDNMNTDSELTESPALSVKRLKDCLNKQKQYWNELGRLWGQGKGKISYEDMVSIKSQAGLSIEGVLSPLVASKNSYPTNGIDDWQDISTGPKDGSIIDLWVIDRNIISKERQYRIADCTWSEDYPVRDGDKGSWIRNSTTPVENAFRDGSVEIITATHWRPLPKPPINTPETNSSAKGIDEV